MSRRITYPLILISLLAFGAIIMHLIIDDGLKEIESSKSGFYDIAVSRFKSDGCTIVEEWYRRDHDRPYRILADCNGKAINWRN